MVLVTMRFRNDVRQSNKTLSLLRRAIDTPPDLVQVITD